MSGKFLLRFDDLCPTINWEIWQKLEEIMIEEDVKPILSVIPDNQDQTLHQGEPNEHFWDRVRDWQARGWTIGLHGYRHEYVTKNSGILGIKNYSEFAGLPLEEQRAKLRKGLEIFKREGVRADVWVAPAHSFDANTVAALRSLGVYKISDGLSPYPHRDAQGVFWVPQQLWKFRTVPFGVWTVCIHSGDELYKDFELFRRRIRTYKKSITSFPVVLESYAQRKGSWMDDIFAGLLGLAIRFKGSLAARTARGPKAATVLRPAAIHDVD
jgi:peptidoglycan/xylan/chitin deacetylase (PgdA/CDA1 family)